MLVQTVEGVESLVTEVDALKSLTVPGPVGGEGLLLRAVPLEDVVGQVVGGIAGANELEHRIAVHVGGARATGTLHVVSEVGSSVEGGVAEGALNAKIDMGARLQVLEFSVVSESRQDKACQTAEGRRREEPGGRQEVRRGEEDGGKRRMEGAVTYLLDIMTAGEVTIALSTEVVRVGLVLDTRLLGGERITALTALVREVVLLPHVLKANQLRVERLVTVVTFKLGARVAGVLAVLVTRIVTGGELLLAGVAFEGLLAVQ